jgi:hypothetical protein
MIIKLIDFYVFYEEWDHCFNGFTFRPSKTFHTLNNQTKHIIFFLICRCSDEKNPRVKPFIFSNQKLKDLGLEFTPVKQCLYDTVKSLQEKGHLPIPQMEENSV